MTFLWSIRKSRQARGLRDVPGLDSITRPVELPLRLADLAVTRVLALSGATCSAAAKGASPAGAAINAGGPDALAGALGVELKKVGYYRLGAGYALPAAQDIPAAIRLLGWTVALAVGVLAIVQVLLSLL